MQLQLKVVEMTQCWNPRVGGVLEWCWMKQLWIRHGDLALRVIQGLKTSRAKGLCMENMNGFYTNLENIYVPQNMILVVFGIVDENGAQAIKNGGGRVLFVRGSMQVHNTSYRWGRAYVHIFLHQCKWRDSSKFLHLRMKEILRNYIKRCETRACMVDRIPIWQVAWPLLCLCVKDGREHVFGKLTSLENRMTCKACDNWSGDDGQAIWIECYYIAFTHVTCFVTSWWVLLQDFQGIILRFLNIDMYKHGSQEGGSRKLDSSRNE